MDNKQNPTTFEQVVMIAMAMGPVLNIYGSPTSMSLAAFLNFFLSVFFFTKFILGSRTVRGKVLWSGMGAYFLYYGAMQFASGSFSLSIVQSFLSFFMAYNCFNRDWYIRFVKYYAIVCMAFFFVQFFGHLTTGTQISGVAKFLPMHEDVDVAEFQNMKIHSQRSSSFFSEPSHFAQFLIPLLAIELFYDESKRHFLFAGVIFVVLLLLQSGTGFIGMLPIALFLIPYFKGNKKMKASVRFLAFMGIAIVALGVVYFFFTSDMGEGIMARTDELSTDYSGGSRSGFLRLWRGYFVFNDYSFTEMLFGVANDKTLLYHVDHSGMSFGITAELYFNALQRILLQTGFVGLGIFTYVLYKIWRGNTICGKTIICTLIAISCVENIYLSNVMIVHLALAESMKIKK